MKKVYIMQFCKVLFFAQTCTTCKPLEFVNYRFLKHILKEKTRKYQHISSKKNYSKTSLKLKCVYQNGSGLLCHRDKKYLSNQEKNKKW